jgi:uncharacterized protein (TIGR01777 family)
MRPLKIVVAGGSGFLGRPLVDRLLAEQHEVIVLSRKGGGADSHGRRIVAWQPDGTAGTWAGVLDGADAVINLAGEGIADRRWTRARKEALEQSRILSTRSLVLAIARATRTPAILISGSGVGYYGDTGDRIVTEADLPGRDFLACICVGWEAEARKAEETGCRVDLVRTGIVLARHGGALQKMLAPFLLFAGGPLGSGRQFMPWIHRDDWVSLVCWLIERRDASGSFNATAPTPVSNREFSKALGRAVHRPSLIPVPAWALRIVVGEIANVALVTGQRAIPEHATRMGFVFRYPTIDEAMTALFQPRA